MQRSASIPHILAVTKRGGFRVSAVEGSKPKSGSELFLERFLPGISPAVVKLRDLIDRLNSQRNLGFVRQVLIVGPSGAGKNHLAQVLAGHRRFLELYNTGNDPGIDAGLTAYTDQFEEVHLPAVPDNLVESELFGYKKGAFTGAEQDTPGYLGGPGAMKGAEKTDILLDEIGDASTVMQAKILRLIDRGEFRPLGGAKDDDVYHTSARLLMATNKPLQQLVQSNQFREDLYWRLLQLVIHVPALSQQRENIESIARAIERDIKREIGVEEELTIIGHRNFDMAWDTHGYDWPGNVRELEQAVRRWFFEQGRLSVQDVVRQAHTDISRLGQSPAVARPVAHAVKERIRAAVRSGASLGALNDVLNAVAGEARSGICEWYDEEHPTEDLLRALFPDARAGSVRNKISEWRNR
jgi:DNA-binding NtrC family response regulator